MPVYDWDGDGLDEAVNLHPDMYYVVDGTGVNLVNATSYNQGIFPGGSPLYATPIVADFLDNGTDTVLFAGSYAQLGLMTKNGAPIWWTPFTLDNTPGFIQGVGDVDGDGDLDLLSPGHPSAPGVDTQSRFRAIDAKTGTLLWSVNLSGHAFAPVGGAYSDTPTLSVSGDVDNDGRVESVFAIGSTLYIVGANAGSASGQIEKAITPDGGLLGSPILADANGDGLAEIIVVSTSGMIYGIGRPASTAGGSDATPLPVSPVAATDVKTDATRGLMPKQQPADSSNLMAELPPVISSESKSAREHTLAMQASRRAESADNLLVVTLATSGLRDKAFDELVAENGKVQFAGNRKSNFTNVWDNLCAELVESVLKSEL
jgi:hypothetical protein